MFEIQYKIVPADYDDYAGENGFLQIIINGDEADVKRL